MNTLSKADRIRGCLVGLTIGEQGATQASSKTPPVYPKLKEALQVLQRCSEAPDFFMMGLMRMTPERDKPELKHSVPFWIAPMFAIVPLLYKGDGTSEKVINARQRLGVSVVCGRMGAAGEPTVQTSILLELMRAEPVEPHVKGIKPLTSLQVEHYRRISGAFIKPAEQETFMKKILPLGNHDMLENPLILSELRKDAFQGALATYLRHPTELNPSLMEAFASGANAPLISAFIGAIMGFHYGPSIFDPILGDFPSHIEALAFAGDLLTSFDVA